MTCVFPREALVHFLLQAKRHTDASQGDEATVAAVLDGLAGADLAHVAAHGRMRSDSPLFSALMLADGALTLYDVERLAVPPTTIILPACNAAAGIVARGDLVRRVAAET